MPLKLFSNPFRRKKGPQVKEVRRPVVRKYRQFKFIVDGMEHIVQSDYANQAELESLTETWAKSQALQLFPEAKERRLVETHDFAEVLKQ